MAGAARRRSTGTADIRRSAAHAAVEPATPNHISEAPESPTQLPIPRPRAADAGTAAQATPTATSELWEALTRARAEYDPLILNAAESAIASVYHPLAEDLLAGRHHRSGPDAVLLRAAELGLRKAIGCWPRPDQPWGFEEYARGAIEMEIRVIHDLRSSDLHGSDQHSSDRHSSALHSRDPQGGSRLYPA